MSMNSKFDCIIITEVIEHLENPGQLLAKASLMLSENGKVIISTPFGICPHPDHRETYYFLNFYELLTRYFTVKSLQYIDQWMGAECCMVKGKNDAGDISTLIREEEFEFQKKEQKYCDRIEELRQNFQLANEKYRQSIQNYEIQKNWLAKQNEKLNQYKKDFENLELECTRITQEKEKLEEKYKEVLKALQELKVQNQNMLDLECTMEEELSECLKDYSRVITTTEQASRTITRLEVQNSALVQKNNELQKKIDIIDNSKVGRLGIRVYQIYKKYMRR